MHKVTIDDCQYLPLEEKPLIACLKAIGFLENQFKKNNLDIIGLCGSKKNSETECPLSISYEDGKPVLYASHYIGEFIYNDVDIIIKPRFGYSVVNYLFQYACEIFMPQGGGQMGDEINFTISLLPILWIALLKNSITYGRITKDYIKVSVNQKNFRGRLNVKKHIKYNIVDQSKFYCTYNKLTPDTTINRTIRACYSILSKDDKFSRYLSFQTDIRMFDEFLESHNVRNAVTLKEIEGIKYTKMNFVYQPLMELSKFIIKRHSREIQKEAQVHGQSFFIDMSELWEMYLLKVLQRGLQGYYVYSPNLTGNIELLDNGRQIRPDIIIEKDEKVVMIIDAKWKSYLELGKTDMPISVSREDLYQMVTYIHHFSNNNENIAGIFVSPAKQEESNNVTFFKNKPKQKIGLINLTLPQDEDTECISKSEEAFLSAIRNCINVVPSQTF